MDTIPDSPIQVHASTPLEDQTTLRAVPAWLLSGAVHGVALGLLSLIVQATFPEVDEVALTNTYIPPTPIVEKPSLVTTPIISETQTFEVPTDEQVDDPTRELEATAEVIDRVEDMVSEDTRAHGREEALADMEFGAQGYTGSIGVVGSGAGPLGFRVGVGKTRTSGKYKHKTGVPRDNAIDRALRWFKRHQSPNGQWDVDGYGANCTEVGPKCEPGRSHTGEDGDIACTAYAVLCYLGMGYDNRMPSPYKRTVQQGIDWLLAQQKADGLWGARNYEHAIATMAIAECYAMSADARLRQPTEKGVQVILARQAKDSSGAYGLGWDYVAANPARNDASVSGWNVMALKSAIAAGIDVGNGMKGSEDYLERAWKAANPTIDPKRIDPYTTTSVFPYTWDAITGAVVVKPGLNSHDLSCVGAVCSVFLRKDAHDPILITLANHIEKTQKPTAWPTNTYYLYYNSMAIFQLGDERFVPWSKQVDTLVCKAQRLEGCFSGSWDWEGTAFHGHDTGRLLSTAYCTLALEVIYRWKQVAH